jgi:hypothetical protein
LAAGAGLPGADRGVRAELTGSEEAELPAVTIAVLARDAPAISGPAENRVRRAVCGTGRQKANQEAGRRLEPQELEAALVVLTAEDTGLRWEERLALAEQNLAGGEAAAVGDEQRAEGHTGDRDNDDSDHRRHYPSRTRRVRIGSTSDSPRGELT